MVTRKPVPSPANPASGLEAPYSPPYPTTPSTSAPPARLQMQDARGQVAIDSDVDSDNAWEEEAVNKHNTGNDTSLPSSLRVGPVGYTPRASQERLATPSSTNPFIQRQHTGSSNSGKESSAGAWGAAERPIPPTNAPPPPPPPQSIPSDSVGKDNTNILPDNTLHQQFSSLSITESNTNPWQPHLDQTLPVKQPSMLSMTREDSGKDAWTPPTKYAPIAPISTEHPALLDLDEPESPEWDEDESPPTVHEMPANDTPEVHQIIEDRHAWDENEGHSANQKRVTPAEEPSQPEGWNLIDHEPVSVGAQHSGVVYSDGAVMERLISGEHAPSLPPRPSQEFPPPQPPRPLIDAATNQSSSSLTTPGSNARKQKKETYEIKKITWHDGNAVENPRVSPILVQNANGPCPLLALVNALTLSTPANVETALVETLRSREQVSLGLLLDAVFDELMSGRRGDAAQELPDVGDLYSFLITLHTGMNVNPRFFSPPPTRSPNDPRNSMSHVHPSEREGSIPGTFEETREMKLYSTFSIPLIHGWLPEVNTPAYASLKRTAQSYEDAQNMFFHEEELEDKLHREGLNFQEQTTLEDISTIKAFFATNATQLTEHGLETITTSVAPGAVAILFRNDHFSTLYRHPATLQLVQLVTDMGYAGHDEVVWESLIDVNGEKAEFFSGDFRLVGGGSSMLAPVAQSPHPDGWATSTGRRHTPNQQSSHRATPSSTSQQDQMQPQSPTTEQEDHDLALALQLQEEEEERHRAEIARRQRETELSQQYIEQQGQQSHGNIPVSQRGGGGGNNRGDGRGASNRSSTRGTSDLRPAIPPRRSGPGLQQPQAADPEAGVDVPPPSYEQAATQAAYVPPANHPAHPNSSPNGAATGRRLSAYSSNAVNYPPGAGRGLRRGTGPAQGSLIEQIPGRRNTAASNQGQGGPAERSERECTVM
jgi:hypothetical protein